MMNFRIAVAIAACMITAGCNEPVTEAEQNNPRDATTRYETICLKGVQYWETGHGRSHVIAPRYDAQTGEVVRC